MAALVSCKNNEPKATTPWGTPIEEVETGGDTESATTDGRFTLNDIIDGGELIMLTVSGPTTYYDYHGHGMGLEYLLCEKFTQSIGVGLRVEVCKDTTEMVKRLLQGEGDIIAYPMSIATKGLAACGVKADSTHTGWLVSSANTELADTLRHWFKPQMIAEIQRQERYLLSSASIKRHVYSPMLNRSKGVISRYDTYFRRYAPIARMDWRLMAAQCYQESTFDPMARSWAGACGLMQIMPQTADHIGLPRAELFNAERNIEASARYMAELSRSFSDVGNIYERMNFVLAAYNGGSYHVRDAMALARKHGGNPHRWSDVSIWILRLQQPQFYNDPVVKHGYMRGSETEGYVRSIRARYNTYRGVGGGGFSSSSFATPEPRKSKHGNRFK